MRKRQGRPVSDVQTVAGQRPADSLGQVLMHEHMIFERPGWEHNSLIRWDREAAVARNVDRLVEARAAGLGALVDLTAIGVARDIPFLREITIASGVPIVACTGWWMAPGITSYFAGMEIDALTRIMIHELTKGIGDTGIRAGIIKVATAENHIDPLEENVLRAAARAQRETGCCISTHTTHSTMGEEQVDLFEAEDADLSKVVIGHSDDRNDLDYLRRLLARGVTVQFDHINVNLWVSDAEKVEMLATLIGEGHVERLTLSQDTVGELPGRPDDPRPFLKRRPAYLLTTFLPMLRQAGVSEAAIEQIMVENPARLLPF